MTDGPMEARVEHIRTAVDGCAWTSIGLGLAFTTVNVQAFGAGSAAHWSLPWLVAWLLDPIPSLLLIAILLTEQITARWQVTLNGWIGVTKWTTFAATAGMNTWTAFAVGSGADIFKHAVPPVMVLLGAQVAPALRDGLTAAVTVAAAQHRAPACPPEDTTPGRSADVAAAEEPAVTDRTAPGGDGAVQQTGAAPARTQASTSAGGLDPRVMDLARRLAAGEDLDGPTSAALVGCSARNARRLLRSARAAAAAMDADVSGRVVVHDAVGPRPSLSVIGGS